MSDDTSTSNVISYDGVGGNHTVDLSALPQSSVLALCKKGLAHFLGNEISSKVTAYKKGPAKKPVNWVEPSPGEIESFHLAAITDALKNLREGTLGQGRATGPRLDPLEAEMRHIAESQVKAIMKANGIKFAKGVAIFADGSTKTMASMIKRRFELEGPAIRKAAEAKLREAEKAAKAALEAAKSAPIDAGAAEAIGL